ncbi:hypothetical protein H5410_031360 [Solanum commersonii]|uniref:Uncharacterized protein n=1 Tax=Solanum commersonii TaxID=4109 RepID=A0A9J5YM32_SOLCO|nr:hypothetical protein H5410_031360 [Solanum commersonii]
MGRQMIWGSFAFCLGLLPLHKHRYSGLFLVSSFMITVDVELFSIFVTVTNKNIKAAIYIESTRSHRKYILTIQYSLSKVTETGEAEGGRRMRRRKKEQKKKMKNNEEEYEEHCFRRRPRSG